MRLPKSGYFSECYVLCNIVYFQYVVSVKIYACEKL